MNSYNFRAKGHANITGTHKNTLEFTKDKEIGRKADCIVGVNSDFDVKELMEFIKGKDKIRVKIRLGEIVDEFSCRVNHEFKDEREMVFRIGEFDSRRTLGLRCSKAAKDLDRGIIDGLKESEKKIQIEIL